MEQGVSAPPLREGSQGGVAVRAQHLTRLFVFALSCVAGCGRSSDRCLS